jgi:hypothetical protein
MEALSLCSRSALAEMPLEKSPARCVSQPLKPMSLRATLKP